MIKKQIFYLWKKRLSSERGSRTNLINLIEKYRNRWPKMWDKGRKDERVTFPNSCGKAIYTKPHSYNSLRMSFLSSAITALVSKWGKAEKRTERDKLAIFQWWPQWSSSRIPSLGNLLLSFLCSPFCHRSFESEVWVLNGHWKGRLCRHSPCGLPFGIIKSTKEAFCLSGIEWHIHHRQRQLCLLGRLLLHIQYLCVPSPQFPSPYSIYSFARFIAHL